MALLTQQQFKKRKPNGDYKAYLNYIVAKGSPAMKRQAKAALKRLGNAGGGGGGGGGYLSQTLPVLNMGQIETQANRLAQGAILPEQQALDRERERTLAESQQQQQLIAGLTQSLGGIVQGIAPQIQSAYQTAGQDQVAFAQGLADGLRQTATAGAQQNSADLEQWGAPAEQISQVAGQGQGGGDVLYGASGFIPGSSLSTQGANWASYGATLPGVVSRMGQQDVAGVAAATRDQTRALSEQAAELAARLPGLRDQYVQQLMEGNRSNLATQMALKELGLAEQQQQFEQGAWLTEFTAGQEGAAAAARTEAQKARDAYKTTLGQEALTAFGDLMQELNPESAGDYDVDAAPGATQGQKKPNYRQAFDRIYARLRSLYSAKGANKWRYAVKDAVVRKMIKDLLASYNIVPGTAAGSGFAGVGGPVTGGGYVPPNLPH